MSLANDVRSYKYNKTNSRSGGRVIVGLHHLMTN